MFEPKKYEDILEQMREHNDAVTDFSVGSVTRTIYESFAYEIALLYEKMHRVYLSAYVDTARDAELDLVVSVLGIRRGLPDFAEGTVRFTRDRDGDDVTIPLGTLLSTEEPKKSYQTFAPAVLPAGHTAVDVKIRALERGETQVAAAETLTVMPRPLPGIKAVVNPDATVFHGKHRESDDELRERAKNALMSSGKATSVSIENALLRLPGVRDVKIVERFAENDEKPAGVIDIYIDTDTDDLEKVFRPIIDQVRAAGILANLEKVTRIEVDGAFRIELNPRLGFSDEERQDLEETVRKALEEHIEGLKMGEALLFSQLHAVVLGVDGVVNLKKLEIKCVPNQSQGDRIQVGDHERITVGTLWVAAEDKPLLVHLLVEATNLGENVDAGIGKSDSGYFQSLNAGQAVSAVELKTALATFAKSKGWNVQEVKLIPEFSQGRPPIRCGDISSSKDAEVIPYFFETPELGSVFVYRDFLDVTGALKVTLAPEIVKHDGKESIYEQIRVAATTYLDGLKPEEDARFDDLVGAATAVDGVLTVELDPDDFRVSIDNSKPAPRGRIDSEKIDIAEFERARFAHLCVTADVEPVEIKAILEVEMDSPPQETAAANPQTAIEKAAKSACSDFLEETEPGRDVSFDKLKNALSNLVPEVSYRITDLQLEASSNDDRVQRSNGRDIHIRSTELAVGSLPTIEIVSKNKVKSKTRHE